ncbi:MAG: c-type cytochrome [Myxococcaceae bacterium]
MRSSHRVAGLLGAGLVLALTSGCQKKTFTEPFELAGGKKVDAQTLNDGHEAFMLYCYGCHGKDGDGHGPSSFAMRPPPRDFRQGLFKFSGGPAGTLPEDAVLDRTIRRGLHGTPMLAWDVPERERHAIIQYVKTFKYPEAAKSRWQEEEPTAQIAISPDPWTGKKAEAVEQGKLVYHVQVGGAGCNGCHASYETRETISALSVKANGNAITDFNPEMYRTTIKATEFARDVNAKGEPLEVDGEAAVYKQLPPDFLFHKVKTAYPVGTIVDQKAYTEEAQREDLYRAIGAGVGGAAMPMWKGALSSKEVEKERLEESERNLWALVYYVQSLVEQRGTANAMALRERLEAQKPAPTP